MKSWTRKKFMELFGEDPVDVLGNDWRNHIDEYEPMGNNAEPIQKLPEAQSNQEQPPQLFYPRLRAVASKMSLRGMQDEALGPGLGSDIGVGFSGGEKL